MRPMLATTADPDRGLPEDGTRWAYEVKWDGIRVLADIRESTMHLYSRNEREVTVAYPELAGLRHLHDDVLLDGEIVVLAGGIPSFEAIQERMHVREARKAAQLAARVPATLVAFDVLRLDGDDLTTRPWQERRDALEKLGATGSHWQVSPAHDELGPLLAATREHGLEGVVAKRRSSRYRPGARSADWVKLAHKRVQAVVVGGWRPEVNDAHAVGALLLGVWVDPVEGGEPWLRFSGRMGSGLVATTVQERLKAMLPELKRRTSPFADAVPRPDAVGTTWVEPTIVVEVRHLGRTEGGRLRQPVFRGFRADLDPADVRDE